MEMKAIGYLYLFVFVLFLITDLILLSHATRLRNILSQLKALNEKLSQGGPK